MLLLLMLWRRSFLHSRLTVAAAPCLAGPHPFKRQGEAALLGWRYLITVLGSPHAQQLAPMTCTQRIIGRSVRMLLSGASYL